jgi:circadian clock protein KaiC
MSMPIWDPLEQQLLNIRKVNPKGLYQGEFACWVQEEVERRGTRMVMIDTLNGFGLCMGNLDLFLGHLQQLVNWLRGQGVSLILTHELANVTGDLVVNPTAMSYITDTVMILKNFESRGEVRWAIGVLKKRLTAHEKQFREYTLTSEGLQIGERLAVVRGILQGEAVSDGEANARGPTASEETSDA